MTKSKTAGFSLDIIAVATAIYFCCCYYSTILIIRLIIIVIVSSSFICYLSCTYSPIWPQTTVIFLFGWPKYGSIYAKSLFSCYFIFGWWSSLNCVLFEDVVFGYVHFVSLNAAYCPSGHMEVIWHLCKMHWNGCDLVIFSTWVCLHADCENSSWSTGVVLLSV